MPFLPTVIRPLDFLPITLAVAGMLAFLVILQRGMGAENRSAYFRLWMPAILFTAVLAATSALWVWRLHVHLRESSRKRVASSQMLAIDAAAFSHFLEFDHWPTGDDRKVMESLLVREGGRSILDKAKLTFASDGSAIDPWGRPYFFSATPERGLTVHSLGPDGVKGSKDDLP